MDKFLIISLGAVLGANLRYWIGDAIATRWGTTFPYGTLLINLTGSLLLGMFLTLMAEKVILDPRWKLLFAVGFMGSYTTFSSYTFEAVNLMTKGQWGTGLVYLLGSAALGALAVFAGVWLGKVLAGVLLPASASVLVFPRSAEPVEVEEVDSLNG